MLFAVPDVQLVYIATPPFLHHEQTRDALRAGKHVIVEKPLAVTMEQADELVSLARDTRLLLVTNLMKRYNPLFGQIKALVDSKLLGDVLRGTFENYACDDLQELRLLFAHRRVALGYERESRRMSVRAPQLVAAQA